MLENIFAGDTGKVTFLFEESGLTCALETDLPSEPSTPAR